MSILYLTPMQKAKFGDEATCICTSWLHSYKIIIRIVGQSAAFVHACTAVVHLRSVMHNRETVVVWQ